MTKIIRKQVWEEKEYFDFEDYNLQNLRDLIATAISKYDSGAIVQRVDSMYSDSHYYAIFVTRDETDDEMDVRIKLERANQSSREEYERRELERLLTKYGK